MKTAEDLKQYKVHPSNLDKLGLPDCDVYIFTIDQINELIAQQSPTRERIIEVLRTYTKAVSMNAPLIIFETDFDAIASELAEGKDEESTTNRMSTSEAAKHILDVWDKAEENIKNSFAPLPGDEIKKAYQQYKRQEKGVSPFVGGVISSSTPQAISLPSDGLGKVKDYLEGKVVSGMELSEALEISECLAILSQAKAIDLEDFARFIRKGYFKWTADGQADWRFDIDSIKKVVDEYLKQRNNG